MADENSQVDGAAIERRSLECPNDRVPPAVALSLPSNGGAVGLGEGTITAARLAPAAR
jgi:hypothetical protein